LIRLAQVSLQDVAPQTVNLLEHYSTLDNSKMRTYTILHDKTSSPILFHSSTIHKELYTIEGRTR